MHAASSALIAFRVVAIAFAKDVFAAREAVRRPSYAAPSNRGARVRLDRRVTVVVIVIVVGGAGVVRRPRRHVEGAAAAVARLRPARDGRRTRIGLGGARDGGRGGRLERDAWDGVARDDDVGACEGEESVRGVLLHRAPVVQKSGPPPSVATRADHAPFWRVALFFFDVAGIDVDRPRRALITADPEGASGIAGHMRRPRAYASGRSGRRSRKIEPHREDDHRHADVLQAPLDEERGLVVEDAIQEVSSWKMSCPATTSAFGYRRRARSELLGLDRDLGPDRVGAGRRQPEHPAESLVRAEALSRALLERLRPGRRP